MAEAAAEPAPMRIAVIGSSGAGKTTFSRTLGRRLGLPVVELDAINWQAGWRDLVTHDPEAFVRLAGEALAGERWITDGNYSLVMAHVWPRVTDAVWLDYPKAVVMGRVIRRSISRALTRRELWPGTGNREDWLRWLDKGHPIRWAWDTFESRRARYEALFADPALAHVRVHRLTRPGDAPRLEARLAAAGR